MEKLKQEEEKKIATLQRDKKHKGISKATAGNNFKNEESDGDDTDSSDDSDNDNDANVADDHFDGNGMVRDKSKSAR